MTLSRSRVSEVVATYPTDDSFKATFRHHHCHHHHHHHRYHHHHPHPDNSPPPFPLTRSAQSSPLTLMQASRKLCELIKAGVAGIFGPVSPVSSNHVQSVRSVNCLFLSTPSVQVTDTLHLPFMETRWEYNFKPSAFSISIHPHPSMLGQAFADFIRLGMMLVLLLICCSGMWVGRA